MYSICSVKSIDAITRKIKAREISIFEERSVRLKFLQVKRKKADYEEMILSFWNTFLQAGRNFFDPVAIRCQDLPRFNPPVGEINPRSLTFWISIRAAVNLGRSLHSLPISHAAVHQEASYSRSTIIGASLSLLWTKDKYFSRNILVRFVKRDILTRVRIR